MSEQHTPGAVKVAEKITLWIDHKIDTGWPKLRIDKTEEIATITDQETDLPEITAERDRLRAEKAELVEAHRAISSLHGNMSLDSIERIGGINDGRDRAIKLRAAAV